MNEDLWLRTLEKNDLYMRLERACLRAGCKVDCSKWWVTSEMWMKYVSIVIVYDVMVAGKGGPGVWN